MQSIKKYKVLIKMRIPKIESVSTKKGIIPAHYIDDRQ